MLDIKRNEVFMKKGKVVISISLNTHYFENLNESMSITLNEFEIFDNSLVSTCEKVTPFISMSTSEKFNEESFTDVIKFFKVVLGFKLLNTINRTLI